MPHWVFAADRTPVKNITNRRLHGSGRASELGSLPEAARPKQSALARLLRGLSYRGVIIGLAGAGVMTSACLLLGGVPTPRLLAMAFCVTGSSYAVDRLVDLKRDTHRSRSRALHAMTGLVPVWLSLFALAVLLGMTSERPLTGLLTLVFPLSVVLYVVPWMHYVCPRLGRAGLRRIKDIPFAKSFYVPACWSLLVVWARPFYPRASHAHTMLAMLFLLPSLFVTAAACDVRDEEADRAAGIVTFPVFLGRPRTITMLRGVQAASMAVFLVLSVSGFLPAVFGALALSGLPVLWCLARLTRPEADLEFFSDVVFDLLWVFQPLPGVAAAILGSCP